MKRGGERAKRPPPGPDATVGDRIRWTIETHLGQSQAAFAAEHGIARPLLNRWLNDPSSTPSEASLEKIANASDVSLVWLRYGAGRPDDVPWFDSAPLTADGTTGFVVKRQFELRPVLRRDEPLVLENPGLTDPEAMELFETAIENWKRKRLSNAAINRAIAEIAAQVRGAFNYQIVTKEAGWLNGLRRKEQAEFVRRAIHRAELAAGREPLAARLSGLELTIEAVNLYVEADATVHSLNMSAQGDTEPTIMCSCEIFKRYNTCLGVGAYVSGLWHRRAADDEE